ncbi:inner membrane-spanning protein YciB [Vannielia litorea]|uniref:Inner membrane-spanning protein YciB n=1 Tax=Vannielia litorea TaxID=1217970 RepID=A0A1N6EI75_9RHOB|nr:septation protein IspZ [Vannielia litorea]SIN82723.1 intracellular septation protein [Vannielia litorea]
MAEKNVPGWVKTALEFGPVLGFFVAFFLLKGESYMLFGHEVKTFTYITFWFVLAMVICMGALWALTGALSRMQVMTLVLVVFMGGLTVVLDNDLFLKLKPTILYALFAGILGIGLLRGQSYLARLMEGLLPMTHEGWMILTRRFVIFFAVLAVANAVVAFALSSGVWVTVKTFGLPAALFAFMMTQYPLIEKYGTEGERGGK